MQCDVVASHLSARCDFARIPSSLVIMFALHVWTINDESYSLPTGCAGHCATLFLMVDAVPAGVPLALTALAKSIPFPLLRKPNLGYKVPRATWFVVRLFSDKLDVSEFVFFVFSTGDHHFGPHEEIERNYARWKHRAL